MKYNWFIFISSIFWVQSTQRVDQIMHQKIQIDKHIDTHKEIQDHDDSTTTYSKKEIKQISTHSCSKNCLLCEQGLCKICPRGLYSYIHSCYDSCPFDSQADNVDMKCKLGSRKNKFINLENPISSKAYTVSRCINSCGKIYSDCRFLVFFYF